MTFLPKDEKEPSTSKYMKFEKGENTFRVLSSAITGVEYWKEIINDDGSEVRKPFRLKPGVPVPVGDLGVDENGEVEIPKYFWAFVVYNRNSEKIQILELTQATIRRAVRALVDNPKWGDPKEYDITVTKEGDGYGTKYTVTPNPKEKMEPEIVESYKKMDIKLEVLYDGGDPFKSDGEEIINVDEIDEALK